MPTIEFSESELADLSVVLRVARDYARHEWAALLTHHSEEPATDMACATYAARDALLTRVTEAMDQAVAA